MNVRYVGQHTAGSDLCCRVCRYLSGIASNASAIGTHRHRNAFAVHKIHRRSHPSAGYTSCAVVPQKLSYCAFRVAAHDCSCFTPELDVYLGRHAALYVSALVHFYVCVPSRDDNKAVFW